MTAERPPQGEPAGPSTPEVRPASAVESLREELDGLRRELRAAERAARETEERSAGLAAELEVAERERADAAAEARALRASLDRLRADHAVVRAELAEARARWEALRVRARRVIAPPVRLARRSLSAARRMRGRPPAGEA